MLLTYVLTASTEPQSYHLYMEQQYIDQLWEDPTSGESFPGWFESSAGACSCMAGFRGSTSVWFPKKSWRIEVADQDVFGCSHFLIDAQYRDLSMMRNVLGLKLTEILGMPVPQTEYVTLSINEESPGLYVRVERIDGFFLDRTGIQWGPAFKSVDSIGRFAWFYSDTTGTAGFEPLMDSQPCLSELHELIDLVNTGAPLPLYIDQFLAYWAVSYAIYDTDALIKNFFLLKEGGDYWNIIPWDRDAIFGNSWEGEYNPEWVSQTSLYPFDISALTHRLLEDEAGRADFAGYLNEVADLMEYELPGMIDSLRTLLTPYIEADPLWQGDVSDFVETCDVLIADLPQRAATVRAAAWNFLPVGVMDISFEMGIGSARGNSIEVLVTTSAEAYRVVLACAFGNGTMQYRNMTSSAGGIEWEAAVFLPDSQYAAFFTAGTQSISGGSPASAWFYFPAYGICDFGNRPTATPVVRRSLALLDPGVLEPLTPVYYGPSLWSLPIINSSGSQQDLSFCCFLLESGRLFLPESTLISPGETFYLTCNSELLGYQCPGGQIFGNISEDLVEGKFLTLLDPSWHELENWVLGECDTVPEADHPIVSEVCCSSPGGDWIELYNPSASELDLTGYYLLDGEFNYSPLMPGTFIGPGGFLIVCRDGVSFSEENPGVSSYVEALDFGLSSDIDGITLVSNTGLTVQVMMWSPCEGWPFEDNSVIALRLPGAPCGAPSSWVANPLPGSPGAPNPGWPFTGGLSHMNPVYPNPTEGGISFGYDLLGLPAEVLLYDISGRLISRLGFLESAEGVFSS